MTPDGNALAVAILQLARKYGETPQQKIALIPLNSGASAAVRLIIPDPRLSQAPIFSQDGKALLYSIAQSGIDNIWSQPLDGGTGHQITNFSSDEISFYELTPDGKNLVLHRRRLSSDVVLLQDTSQ